jgi:hypothetical protein
MLRLPPLSDLVQQGCCSAETAKDADIGWIAANALGEDGAETPTRYRPLYKVVSASASATMAQLSLQPREVNNEPGMLRFCQMILGGANRLPQITVLLHKSSVIVLDWMVRLQNGSCLSAVRSSSELNGGGGGEGSLLQVQVVAAKMQTSVFSTRGQRAQTTVD